MTDSIIQDVEHFLEDDVVNPLIGVIEDPFVAFAKKVAAAGVTDLANEAETLLKGYKPNGGATSSPLNAAAAGFNAGVDGVITSVLGGIPVAGAQLSAAAIAEANEALDDLYSKADTAAQGLIAAAKAKLLSMIEGTAAAQPAVAEEAPAESVQA